MDNAPSPDLTISENKRAHSRSWFSQRWVWGLGLLLVLVGIGSRLTLHLGYLGKDERAVEQLITQFHERMNAGQFEAIYSDTHQGFKDVFNKENAFKAMQATQDEFGSFKGVRDSEFGVVMGAPVQVRAAYNSEFEKGDATERFVFLLQGNSFQLSVYQISPGMVKLEHRPPAQP